MLRKGKKTKAEIEELRKANKKTWEAIYKRYIKNTSSIKTLEDPQVCEEN